MDTGAGKCTGTLVRNRWVLTAAHCVTDDGTGDEMDPNDVTVFRFYDGVTIDAFSIIAVNEYNGGGSAEPRDDWALIQTNAWPTTPTDTMDLWGNTDDAILEALTKTRTLSYPGYTLPGGVCSFSGSSQLFRLIEDEPIAQVQANSLRMKIDSSEGASGAPWFFCPLLDDDECLSGEPGWVYGVNSGYNSVIDRQVGPKVPYFKADALAIIDGTYVEQ